jgi:hypothetical protein
MRIRTLVLVVFLAAAVGGCFAQQRYVFPDSELSGAMFSRKPGFIQHRTGQLPDLFVRRAGPCPGAPGVWLPQITIGNQGTAYAGVFDVSVDVTLVRGGTSTSMTYHGRLPTSLGPTGEWNVTFSPMPGVPLESKDRLAWRVYADPPHVFVAPDELFLPWGEIIESDETNNTAEGPPDCTIR